MAISDINSGVIGAGPVSKADLRAQFDTIETELQKLHDESRRRKLLEVTLANGTPSWTYVFPAGYRLFEIELDNVALVTNNNALMARISNNGGVSYSSTIGDYAGAGLIATNSGNSLSYYVPNTTAGGGGFLISPALTNLNTLHGKITVRPVAQRVSWDMDGVNATPAYFIARASGVCTPAITAIQLIPSIGNFSQGNILVTGRLL